MSEGATMQDRELSFEPTLLDLRAEDGWEKKNGGWWISSEVLDPRAMAHYMLDRDARFMTLTAIPREGGETGINFHWDWKGLVLTFSTQTHNNKSASIGDLCPAADWIERETYEYFAVEFTGRDNSKPLMLRPGLEAGLNRKQDTKL